MNRTINSALASFPFCLILWRCGLSIVTLFNNSTSSVRSSLAFSWIWYILKLDLFPVSDCCGYENEFAFSKLDISFIYGHVSSTDIFKSVRVLKSINSRRTMNNQNCYVSRLVTKVLKNSSVRCHCLSLKKTDDNG